MAGSDPFSLSFLLAGADGSCDAVIIENVTDDFVERVGLYGLLDKVARALLQGGEDIVLIADGRNHHNACVRMFLDNTLDGFDALHLRHGDIHQNDVGFGASIFGDGGATVTRFADHLTAEGLDHPRKTLSRED